MPASPETATSRAELTLGRAVKELLDQAQVAVAADEWRLEAPLALRAADPGHDPQRAPQPQRLGLALDRVLAGVLVGDRSRGHLPGHLVDEHGPGIRGRLDARRRC